MTVTLNQPSRTMKQNLIAPLVAVVIASVIGRSEAVSCYRCNYTDWPEKLGPSTCTDPLNAATTPKCSSSYCIQVLAKYTESNNASTAHRIVSRDCVNDSYYAAFNCELFPSGNCSFFRYKDNSCYYIQVAYPAVFTITTCFCGTDYCNGAMVSDGQPSNEASVLEPCACKWFGLLAALAVMFDRLFKA